MQLIAIKNTKTKLSHTVKYVILDHSFKNSLNLALHGNNIKKHVY